MSLKMKLTASISAFFLVVGLMLIGIMAVNQATVNMGGSINFTATDVYARVTGSIVNDTSSPSNLDVTYSADETTGDPTVWNDLSLAFDSQATPIEVTITVENLSAQNTLRVNLNDTLSSTVGNLEKVVKNDGGDYTNQTDITLQPNGQENDSTTFTITMSVIDKNTSLTADFDYELNLFDQYYVEPQTYEYFTFTENGDGTVELTGFVEEKAPSTDIVIPESVSYVDGVWMDGDTYTVTDILSATSYSNGVFYHSGITSIEFPSTLETIGNYAFRDCSGLTGALDLSNCTSLTSIGNQAFWNCGGLKSIDLSNCTNLTSIGSLAFSDCSGLTGALDLSNCTSLTSIGNQAFHDCSGLTGALDLSNCTNLTSIGGVAFQNCSGLTSITLPSSLTSIGGKAFRNCSGLTGALDLSNFTNLASIGNYAFEWCSGLTSITLPSCLTSIGMGAFDGCSGLTSITLPSGLTSIGESTFQDCSGLTEVDLSNCTSLTSIGEQAFADCSGLTELDLSNCTNLTSIESYAFDSCSRLTSITLPSSLTSIGNGAFSGCTNLQPSVTDQGVKYLGNSENPYLVLWDGTDITTSSYTVNEKCKFIYNAAFDWCSGLKSIDLSNCTSLTSIGSYAFASCSRLTSITLPSSLTSIGNGAFDGCGGLTSITLPSSLTSIGSFVFQDCYKLPSIDLSNCTSLTSIGGFAFRDCSGLTSIDLSNCTSLTSIGGYAFENCTGITSVTINEYVFRNVTSSLSSCGYILNYIGSGETVLVPANLIDDLGLTNSYLNGSSFTRSATAVDGYYVYTKI